MQTEPLLLSAKCCVEQADLSALTALLRSFDSPSIQDPAFHLELAGSCEKMGLLDLAVRECGLALRDAPTLEAALRCSLRLSLEQGNLPHAERDARLLLQTYPQDVPLRLELGRILEISGRFNEALEVYQSTTQGHESPQLQEAKRRAARYAQRGRSRPAVDDPIFHDASDPEQASTQSHDPEPLAPTEADAISFAHLFSGREGVYARQWYSDTGKSGYTPVHQPFTPLVARSHLLGNYTVGIYPLRMNHSVLFLAFDVDIVQEALTKAAKDQQPHELPRLIRTAHSVARQLLDACAMFDIPAVLEDSGWKGRHLWIFFSEPVPAASARRIAQWLLHTVGPLPEVCRVEIFPKQSRLDPKQLGNLIKLPLGIHRVTGRICALLNPDGSHIERPIEHLRSLKKLSRQRLQELLVHADHIASLKQERQHAPPKQTKYLDPIDSNTAPQSAELAPSAHPPSPTPAPYRVGKDEEVEQVLRGCPVLRAIVGRALSTGILSSDDIHILIYTMGNLTQGDAAVNAVLSKVHNVDPRVKLKSPLRSYPTSCPKIRARLPELTASVPCHCAFPQHTGSYPHPLLHLARPPQLPSAPTISPYPSKNPPSAISSSDPAPSSDHSALPYEKAPPTIFSPFHPAPSSDHSALPYEKAPPTIFSPFHPAPSFDHSALPYEKAPPTIFSPSRPVLATDGSPRSAESAPPSWEILEKPSRTPSRSELESWTHRLQQAHQDLSHAQQSILALEHKIAQFLHNQGTQECKTRFGTLRVDSKQRVHFLLESSSPEHLSPSTDPLASSESSSSSPHFSDAPLPEDGDDDTHGGHR